MEENNTTIPDSGFDTPIYCIKCTNFTANKDPIVVKRETHHLKALCVKCNSKKNKFLKRNHKITTKEKNIESKPDVINSDPPEQSNEFS